MEQDGGGLIANQCGTINNSGTIQLFGWGALLNACGTLTNSGTLNAYSAILNYDTLYNSGTLVSGAYFDDEVGTVSSTGTFIVNGVLDDNGNMTLLQLANGGTINVGLSSSLVVGSISGGYGYTQMADGLLAENIGSSNYGQINANGPASLSGTLNIVLQGGFNPRVGSTYKFLNFTPGSLSGTFSIIQNASFNNGTEMWVVNYDNSDGYVELIAEDAGQGAYTLSVSKVGTGSGTVTSGDGFINCGSVCSFTYDSGTRVTLTATPAQGSLFAGWSGCDSTQGNSCVVTVNSGRTVTATFNVATPLQLVTVTPCRLVDTRPQYGGRGPIVGGTYRIFPISGAPNCSIPASATAYSLNVTVVPSGPLGFLTMWPTGEDRPLQFSTLNSLDGRIKANAAIVPAGSSGDVSVYVTNTTNVILDIDGYFAPVSGSTLAFYTLPPCRVADTRYPNSGGLGSPYLAGGQERPFPILNATACDIPSSAAAYSLNFTVVPHGPLGVLTVWPTGGSRPNVSTLNDIPGTIVANAAIVAAGAGGEVSVYPTNDTDLVIDINGYFAPAGTGGLSLYPAAPCRVIDTRKVGGGLPFSGTLSPPVDVVDSPCEPPAQAQAYVLNATVVPQGGLGYLTLWPDGTGRPLPFSTLNAIDGWITSNMAIVASTNGKVDAYALGSTQLILDISAYFAP
jgi:hypothetical protein